MLIVCPAINVSQVGFSTRLGVLARRRATSGPLYQLTCISQVGGGVPDVCSGIGGPTGGEVVGGGVVGGGVVGGVMD